MIEEQFDTYDKRAKRATLDYPEESNISERVRKFERANGLTAFTPKEILAQRNNVVPGKGKMPKPLERSCPQCEGKMFAKGVCPSCEAYAQGMRTHWICAGCQAEQFSEKDAAEWSKELSA